MNRRAGLPGRWRALFVVSTLGVVGASVTDVATPQGRQPTAADLVCPPAKRAAALRKEQTEVLDRLGALTRLESRQDLDALAKAGFTFLPNQFTSFEGIGLTVQNPSASVSSGTPNLLFYTPSKDAKDATDPRGPDFPYTLAGWGYGISYVPDRIPTFLPCTTTDDWSVHERGVNPLDTGGMIAMPPAESAFGGSAGLLSDPPAMQAIVGFPHARSWTVHLWKDASGVAKSGVLAPKNPPPGLDPGVGSNFYFLDDPPKGVLEPFATLGRPAALQAGEGERVTDGDTAYTLKVSGAQDGGEFSLLEVAMNPGATRQTQSPTDHAESYYVVGGEMTFEVGGQTLSAGKGGFVYLPAGPGFTARATGPGPARALLVASPGGVEKELGFRSASSALTAPLPSVRQAPPASRASLEPYVLRPGEGEVTKIRGSTYVFKAKTEDTGGAFGVMEINFIRGATAPPHIHHRETESFYLLDGEMTFFGGGQTLPARGGTNTFLPVGLLHVYNVDSDNARVLLVSSPAGLEKFFRELGLANGKPLDQKQALGFGVEPVLPPGATPGAKP